MNLAEIKQVLNATLLGENVSFAKVSTDTRTLDKDSLFVALEGETFDGHQYISQALERGAKAVVVTKADSVPANTNALVVSDTVAALGQLAKYHRSQFDIPCIAVTGSCGKTSTRTMITEILSLMGPTLAPTANFNNHIGLPLTILKLKKDHQYMVLEMGASAPKEIAYLSDIGQQTVSTITNVYPAHLEGFGSIEAVLKAKSEIYEGLDDMGVAVLNLETPYVADMKKVIGQRPTVTYGLDDQAMIYAKQIMATSEKTTFTLVTPQGEISCVIHEPGEHQVINALAAVACVYTLEVPLSVIQKGLANFQGVKGRMNRQTLSKGLELIDDTYNASPAAFEVAINYLAKCPGQKILVMGDMAELGADAQKWHHAIGLKARDQGIDVLYAVGSLSQAAVEGFGFGAKWFERKEDLLEALKGVVSPATVLVKGSRSVKMETIVNDFINHKGC